MTIWKRVLVLVGAALLSACESDSAPTCKLDNGTQLASVVQPATGAPPQTAPWPKFRADTANTGRAPNADLTNSTGIGALLFDRHCSFTTSQACRLDADCPPGELCLVPRHCNLDREEECRNDAECGCADQICQTCVDPIGAVATTPIIGFDTPPSTLHSIYAASSDGTVYVFRPPGHCSVSGARLCSTDDECPDEQTCERYLADSILVLGAIVGSPLLGNDGTLFVPSSGVLTQFDADGAFKNGGTIPGFLTASPNIWNGRFCSVTTTQACSDDPDNPVPCPSGETCEGSVDGTVYIPSPVGFLTGMCPNGVPRFGVSFPGTQSSAAIVPDPNFEQPNPLVIAGGVGGQVRAYNVRGRQYWSFFASATVVAAVLIDQDSELFYVADTGGRVFAGNMTNGQAAPSFSFATDVIDEATGERPGITASPALGRDDAGVLYIVDQGQYPDRSSILYALDRTFGTPLWTYEPMCGHCRLATSKTCCVGGAQSECPTGDECEVLPLVYQVSSSPAVATGGDKDVIVFAADLIEDIGGGPVATGGRVFAVQDDGDEGTLLWTFDPGFSIGASSPSIGDDDPDGSGPRIYIGRTGNRLGRGDECPETTPAPTLARPTGQATAAATATPRLCVVNEGGAVYEINVTVTITPTATPTATPTTTPTASPSTSPSTTPSATPSLTPDL